jgi:hypothetical protein
MSALTLDEIRAEAERLYGGPLRVTLEPEPPSANFDWLLYLYDADIDRSVDMTVYANDLDEPILEFTQRILEPCVAVLSTPRSDAAT